MRAYPLERRQAVRADLEMNKLPVKVVARIHGVSQAWVRRVRQRWGGDRMFRPCPRGGKRFQKIDREHLERLVKRRRTSSLTKLREQLGVECTPSAISAALHKLGWRFDRSKRRWRGPEEGPRVPPPYDFTP